jgi:hypothetical protein
MGSYFLGGGHPPVPGSGYGLRMAYTGDDTLAVSAGEIILPNRQQGDDPGGG